MALSDVVKVPLKQKVSELQATVAFLTNTRNTLISAGTVLKGENDRLRKEIDILSKKLEYLKQQCDKDDQRFSEYDQRFSELTFEVERLRKKASLFENAYNKQVEVSRGNAKESINWREKFWKTDTKLGWSMFVIALAVTPYAYFAVLWLFVHIRICLH